MNIPGHNFPWNDASVAILKQLHADGHSFSIIAAELSIQFRQTLTRSAAIGKASRLGLERAEPTHAIPRTPRAPRSPRQYKARRAPFRPSDSLAAPIPFIAPAPILEPAGAYQCDLIDLTNEKCRWPIGDGTFRFCGEPEADLIAGAAYCRFHSKRAFRKPGSQEPASEGDNWIPVGVAAAAVVEGLG